MYNNQFSQRYGNNINNQNQQQKNQSNQNNQSNTSFEQNRRLSAIDPMKLKIIDEIKKQSKSKSIEELLPEIMKINNELNRRNMNFTKQETELLMEAIEETLDPADRKKFQMLKSFM